ncbi:MAG: riboflavin synthase [Verrucomicrobiota bacterium]
MFTGIVESCGTVSLIEPIEKGAELWIRAEFQNDLALGESVAVNGACLTVTEVAEQGIRFDLLHETLRLTNLGSLAPGSLVNLERSLRVGDRLSGHFVQGHVDACAEILRYDRDGQDHRLEVSLPRDFVHLVVPKGSICVNGTSLTVAEILPGSVVIWIIPHTHEVTSLRTVKAGDRANLEFDLLAKQITRLIDARGGLGSSSISD